MMGFGLMFNTDIGHLSPTQSSTFLDHIFSRIRSCINITRVHEGHSFSPGNEEYPCTVFYFEIFVIFKPHILHTYFFTKLHQINDLVFVFILVMMKFLKKLYGIWILAIFHWQCTVYINIYTCVRTSDLSHDDIEKTGLILN